MNFSFAYRDTDFDNYEIPHGIAVSFGMDISNYVSSKMGLIDDSIRIEIREILQKIKDRNTARDNKNYELADKIRNELSDKGVLIEDKDDKTSWKLK